MPAEDEGLEGEQQRLHPQNDRVHESESVDSMKSEPPDRARTRRDNFVVIVGIGVGDAAAARRDPVEAAFVERFESGYERARPRHLLRVEQLLAASELRPM